MSLVDPLEGRGRRREPGRQFARWRGPRAELGDPQHHRPNLLLLKLGEDSAGRGQVAHLDGLRRRPEERLDRASELGLDLDPLGDGGRPFAGEGLREPALEHRLRPLAEPLPPLLELLQETQACAALRHLPVGLLYPALDPLNSRVESVTACCASAAASLARALPAIASAAFAAVSCAAFSAAPACSWARRSSPARAPCRLRLVFWSTS